MRFGPPVPPPSPAQARIRVEQLRFVLTNSPTSMIVAGLGNVALAWVFSFSAPAGPLIVWSLLSWLPVLVFLWVARRFLQSAQPQIDVHRYTGYVIALWAVLGAVRGLLPWIAFDEASPLLIALMICFMTGIQAGAMALTAPVLPVFVGYTSLFSALVVIKLVLLGGLIYSAIGLGTVLFSISLLASAYKASATFRRMLELRFENVELVECLRAESDRAEAARVDAENANQAKSKFLAAASHDLRQPIHAQGLFLEVLARSALSDTQREVLANARAACHATGEMLNTLLDFSRIEAAVVALNVRPFRLQALLNKLETELAPQADKKGLIYRTRETSAVVESDPALVELILRNLISNAIRYTQRGGILIGARRRGAMRVLEVWDTGIGIAPENQQVIFREFHQLGNPERDRRHGLGLGLAIAQRLAQVLDHELVLASRLGRGSVFALALPSTALPLADVAAPARTDDPVGVLDLRVLVIDDDEAVRTGMRHWLSSWGAQCDVAETIEEALASAEVSTPQLVICDYRLRERHTGAQAIAALRQVHAGLPAILITGDTAPDRLREARASGLPLLHKPVQPADLYRKIIEVFAE
jgi:signal transduction histidine kinase